MQGQVASRSTAGAAPRATCRMARLQLRALLAQPLVQRKQNCRRRAAVWASAAVSQGEESAPAAEENGSAPAAAAAAPAAPAVKKPAKRGEPQKEEDLTAEWDTAIDQHKNCATLSGRVVRTNAAGVNVKIGKLLGFIPYKLVDPERLPGEARTSIVRHPAEGYPQLKGKTLNFKIMQINVPERRLVCSERAAMLDELSEIVKAGDVLEGRVTAVRDFGAFVEVKGPGRKLYGPEVLLPLREVSWDWIPNTAGVLTPGQEIKCIVTNLQGPPKTKIYVSLKRLQEDPLQQTLDKVMPLDGQGEESEVPANVPGGVEDILDELSKEEGISQVTLGRQAVSAGTVSQDLELWLTKEEVADGFNLVARAGRVVQEIHVATQLSKDEMKQAVQRVLARLV